MSMLLHVTGAVPSFGRSVSHSNRRSPRRFDPTIQSKRFHVPSLGRTVRLQVPAKGLRNIDRHGIEAVVARIRARGEKI